MPRDRPFVWVNYAMSLDGKLALPRGKRTMLSGPEDWERVQRARADSDAVLVGVGTILKDNPSLRVHWELLHRKPRVCREPGRIVLDSRGRTPPGSHVLDHSAKTIIITVKSCRRKFPKHVAQVAFGIMRVDLSDALRWLREEAGVRKLMVEGGSKVITSFLREGLVDRMTVFVAPVIIGGSNAPSIIKGGSLNQKNLAMLRLRSARRLDDGVLLKFEKRGLYGTEGQRNRT